MKYVWTKECRELVCEGNVVLTPEGDPVGRIRGDRVFRTRDSAYVGTLVGDRLVFRSFDADGPDRPYSRPVTQDLSLEVTPLRTWGDEPVIEVDTPLDEPADTLSKERP